MNVVRLGGWFSTEPVVDRHDKGPDTARFVIHVDRPERRRHDHFSVVCEGQAARVIAQVAGEKRFSGMPVEVEGYLVEEEAPVNGEMTWAARVHALRLVIPGESRAEQADDWQGKQSFVRSMVISEVAGWLKERGLLAPKRFDLVEEVDYSKLVEVRWFGFHPRVHEALADTMTGLFADEEQVLMCIDDWAMDLDEATLNLFYRLRQALGESAKVWEKPGHLFQGNHLDMHGLLRLVLALGWDVYLVSGSGKLLARVFDGDIFSLYAADPASLDTGLLEQLDELAKSHPDYDGRTRNGGG